MNDDDDALTPPRGKSNPMWGDTRRSSSLREREARVMQAVLPEPTTDTYDLVEREPSQSAVEVMRRSRRNSEDPATFRDIVNIAEELRRTQRREPTEVIGLRAEIAGLKTEMAALRTELAEIKIRLRDIDRDMGTAKWLMRGALTATVGALLFVGKLVWTRAETEGRDLMRLENTERQTEENRQDIRAIVREKDKSP